MNPSHENVKTRPYLSKGLKTGIDKAFRLLGLTSGETKSSFTKSIAHDPLFLSMVCKVCRYMPRRKIERERERDGEGNCAEMLCSN